MKTDSFLFRFGQALKPGRCFSCCLLLLLACLSAQAQLDTDGDGLSNDDEAAIYFTNPASADTDGDGMPDGLETQLGTDPRNASSVLRMSVPLTMPGGVRRFCWTSQSGQTYQLQNADPRTNAPGGGLVWRPIVTFIASGTSACVDVVNPVGLYRVQPVVATNNDALPPLLSLIQAIPPLPGGTSALLSVVARDLAGVVRVEFLDGANVLGTATRGAGDGWNFSWPLNINLNGRHHLRARAYDAAGNVGYSPVLAFNVSIGAQSCVTIGSVQICADSIVNSNGTLRATGHVRVGGITFSADTVLTISGALISGSGSVTVPGLGTVLTGSFDINATTGWLTVRVGTTPIYSGIVFGPRISLPNPTSLLLNVFSNSLCTSGSLLLQVPNHVFGPATFTGTICFDPLAASLAAVGSMTMSSLSATGTATLLLKDSTFTLAGNARLTSSNGDVYTVSNGVARLSYAQAVPTIAVSGRLGIPEDISVQVQGNIFFDGVMSLTGANGQGTMNGFRFAAASGTLTRPAGVNTAITLQFNARLVHSNLVNYLVGGTVRSTGDIDIIGTGMATFTTNINNTTVVAVFNPLNVRLRGNIFAGNVSNAFSGTLFAPNYLEPVQFLGIMRADGSVDIAGTSGPYTAATFGGLVPAMDAPGLSLEERIFVGAYHLFSRNSQTTASVDLRFVRAPDASNGVATLSGRAIVTTPGLPPLILNGSASSTGAANLTGSITNQNCTVWGHTVNNLSAAAVRQTNGAFSFSVTGGTLVYSGLNGVAAQVSGGIASDGSGFIDFTYTSCTLNGYTLQNVTLRLAQTANGTRSLSILGSGRLVVPGFVGVTVQVSGGMTNNGTFSLTGTLTAGLTLVNLPVTSMAANASATLTQSGLTIAGSVSGMILTRLPVVVAPPPATPAVPAMLIIPATGLISISGCVTVSPIVSSQFQLRSTAPDGSFTACLRTNGLEFPANAVLLYRGSPLTLPALPVFTVSANGNFSIGVSNSIAAGFTLNGYGLPSLSFTFVRSGAVTLAQNVNATLRVPGFNPGFLAEANFNVSGSLNSDGTFNLTNTSGYTLTLTGLPINAVSASQLGNVSFRNTGLTVTGSMSGGVLGQIPAVTAIGTLNVASNGYATASGCITVSPLFYDQFRLESTAPDGGFSACFTTNGLTFPSGARLLYRGSPLTLPALPSFTISASGDFNIDVTVGMTAGLTLNGYNLPSLSFTLVRSGGVTFAQNVNATVRAPGFNPGFTGNADFGVNGALNSDGTFNLTGTARSGIALTGLPVGTVNASAVGSVHFRETGLFIDGTFIGGLFSQLPVQSGMGGGLLAEYYDNIDFTGPKVVRVDGAIDFDWGNGQPDAGIGADTFSARWTGWVQPEFSETYTFITTSDDGVRLWVNNQLLINNWTDHAPTEDSATISLRAGQHYEIRMEYYESGAGAVARLSWSSPSQAPEIIPSARLFRSAAGTGLLAEYFDNIDFTGPKVTRVDGAIDFDWGTGQPDPGIGADTFSARWTGWVQPAFSETYTFYTTSDDGVRLWVNNQLLIDNWTDHGPVEDSGSITLQAGQYYAIRMEYYEGGGGAVARLEWFSPSRNREIVPNSRLSRSATGGGLLGEYFDKVDFTGATVTRVDGTVDFDWGNGQPVPGIGEDTFSARWTGWVQPAFSETYTFFTFSDDGVRLWVNNQLLIDNWTDHGPVENSGLITLQAGQYYSIRMEYYEGGGGAVARLSWSSPSRTKEIVPNSRLFQERPSFGLSGVLEVAANGSVRMAGCVTVSPLVSGQFRLESTQPGGSFTACFGPDGLTFPTGARLLYRGSPLTLPALPSFTIAANGNFSLNVSNSMTAGARLTGFDLPGLSFTLTRTGNVLAVQNLNATVRVPGVSGGFAADATFTVGGNLNSDGTFNLTGTGGGGLTLSGLPVGPMNVNASAANSVNFRDTGLTVTVSCSGGVLDRVPPGFTATATLTIFSNGSVTLAGTVMCPSLQNGVFTIERLNGGNLQAALDNNGLRFSAWQVRVAGVFNVAFPLLPQTMNLDGSFNVGASVTPPNFTVVGYGFTGVGFTVNRSSNGTLSITGFNGNLFNVPGFTQRFLGGSINNAGSVVMDWAGTVTLGGFNNTSGGRLELRNGGLTAIGTFAISFGNVSGSFFASLTVTNNGTYAGGVFASLTIDDYSTESLQMICDNTGLRGGRHLNFGGLQVWVNLVVSPSSISGSGSIDVDTPENPHQNVGRWNQFVEGIDPRNVDSDDGYARLKGTVSLSLSSSGTVTGTLGSQTVAWWRVNCADLPFCTGVNYPPNDINQVAEGIQRFSLPALGIGSNGQVTVAIPGNPFGQSSFCFDFWGPNNCP